MSSRLLVHYCCFVQPFPHYYRSIFHIVSTWRVLRYINVRESTMGNSEKLATSGTQTMKSKKTQHKMCWTPLCATKQNMRPRLHTTGGKDEPNIFLCGNRMYIYTLCILIHWLSCHVEMWINNNKVIFNKMVKWLWNIAMAKCYMTLRVRAMVFNATFNKFSYIVTVSFVCGGNRSTR